MNSRIILQTMLVLAVVMTSLMLTPPAQAAERTSQDQFIVADQPQATPTSEMAFSPTQIYAATRAEFARHFSSAERQKVMKVTPLDLKRSVRQPPARAVRGRYRPHPSATHNRYGLKLLNWLMNWLSGRRDRQLLC